MAFLTLGQAQATPLIDFTADNSSFTWYGNDSGCSLGCTLGYSFNVTSTVTIDGLGILDVGADGLNNTHQVGLWNGSGTLIASTTVGPGSSNAEASASGAGDFVYSNISDLTLVSGDYTVGALYQIGDTDPVVFNASGIFSNDANVTYGDLQWINTGSFQEPTNSGSSNDRYFGPGIHIASQVPEPGILALLGLGLIGFKIAKQRKH